MKLDSSDIRYCMRCLVELQDGTRRCCFRCNRVTCSEKSCGIWAVPNRFWTCQVCIDDEIEATIDVHEKRTE